MGTHVAVKVGRVARLEQLYVEHIDRAVRLAFLLTGDEQQARDIAQEAFVKIAGRFRDLRNPDAFPAYLRTTIVNLSRSHLRRLRTQRAYLDATRHSQEVTTSPDVETRDQMWRAVMTLPHRQRAAVVLRFYEDLTEDQIAHALHTSRSAVKSLINRGLNELRRNVGSDRRE